jgi:hypothetical protein
LSLPQFRWALHSRAGDRAPALGGAAPDQKDEDSLPPYDVLDRILELYVEQDISAEAIIAEGIAREHVERAVRLVDLNEYKRGRRLSVCASPAGFRPRSALSHYLGLAHGGLGPSPGTGRRLVLRLSNCGGFGGIEEAEGGAVDPGLLHASSAVYTALNSPFLSREGWSG